MSGNAGEKMEGYLPLEGITAFCQIKKGLLNNHQHHITVLYKGTGRDSTSSRHSSYVAW